MSPQSISVPEVERRFDYHAPSGVAKDMHAQVRAEAKQFAGTVLFGLPEGREKSLAFTAFEEATFWAHAAIAREPDLHAAPEVTHVHTDECGKLE